MQRLRTFMHRPSPAMLVALTALVVAMSGTAVAATGGAFILGKSNQATSVSALTNTKGTALRLSSKKGTPPLTVSNSVRVPMLNATKLDGHHAAAFLPAKGTAANSAELGGQPAGDYMTGSGQVSHTADTIPYNNTVTLNLPNILSDDYNLQFTCTNGGLAYFDINSNTNLQVFKLNQNGDGYVAMVAGEGANITPPDTLSLAEIQVTFVGNVVSTFMSQGVNTTNQTCTYVAQAVSDG